MIYCEETEKQQFSFESPINWAKLKNPDHVLRYIIFTSRFREKYNSSTRTRTKRKINELENNLEDEIHLCCIYMKVRSADKLNKKLIFFSNVQFDDREQVTTRQ